MLFRQHGITRTQLFPLVILFFIRGDFGGGYNEWTKLCYFNEPQVNVLVLFCQFKCKGIHSTL